jgi:hypothetical protein
MPLHIPTTKPGPLPSFSGPLALVCLALSAVFVLVWARDGELLWGILAIVASMATLAFAARWAQAAGRRGGRVGRFAERLRAYLANEPAPGEDGRAR